MALRLGPLSLALLWVGALLWLLTCASGALLLARRGLGLLCALALLLPGAPALAQLALLLADRVGDVLLDLGALVEASPGQRADLVELGALLVGEAGAGGDLGDDLVEIIADLGALVSVGEPLGLARGGLPALALWRGARLPAPVSVASTLRAIFSVLGHSIQSLEIT